MCLVKHDNVRFIKCSVLFLTLSFCMCYMFKRFIVSYGVLLLTNCLFVALFKGVCT